MTTNKKSDFHPIMIVPTLVVIVLMATLGADRAFLVMGGALIVVFFGFVYMVHKVHAR